MTLILRGLCLLLVLALTPSAVHAARGFGSNDGTTTTDKVVTGHTSLSTSTSWCQWVWLTGAGGAGLGRLWDKDSTTTGRRVLLFDDPAGKIEFSVGWSLAVGGWTIAAPATGGWHHLCLTYNASSTANDPLVYLDGTSRAVTETVAPSGTLQTNTGAYIIGNRSDDTRNLNGRMAEFAIWQGTILTAGNVATLYNGGAGARADSILGSTPTTYWTLCGSASPEPNEIVGGATGTVTGALQHNHPFSNCVEDTPPTPVGTQFNDNCSQLSWTANLEPDFAGYRIYDRARTSALRTLKSTIGQASSIPCSSLSFNPGQHYASISAVDLSGNEGPISADVPFFIVRNNQISDLRVTIVNATDITLAWTEVDDGTGSPAKTDIRFATPTINWGAAVSVTSGTCSQAVAGVAIGATRTCTVTGLSTTTPYQFQGVPYRGTLGSSAVFGPLSNITEATTGGAPPGPAGLVTMASDTFNRADGGLGSAWITLLSSPWLINSNVIQAPAGGPVFAVGVHTTELPAKQFCRVTITTIAGTDDLNEGCLLRAALDPAVFTGYLLIASKGTSVGWKILLYQNGSYIREVAFDATVPIAGDILRAEAEDDQLRIYVNDILTVSGTDAALATGYAGLTGYLNAGVVGNMQLNDFSSGTWLASSADTCGCN